MAPAKQPTGKPESGKKLASKLPTSKSEKPAKVSLYERMRQEHNNGESANQMLHVKGAKKWQDIEGELLPEYVKPAELFKMGPFYIVGSSERWNIDFSRHEINYDLRLVYNGSNCVLTLGKNSVRERLAKMVEKYGTLGPFVLVQIPAKNSTQSPAWGFNDWDGDESSGPTFDLQGEPNEIE